jgi:hypothetical protein
MKVLLLHPDDHLPRFRPGGGWDLVVDFSRASAATYDEWSRRTNCPVLSLYDFAEEIQDLHRTKNLLCLGLGQLLDRTGLDWWDVLSLMIVPDLQQLMLVHRLAERLQGCSELYTTRPDRRAKALQALLGVSLINLESWGQSKYRSLRHLSNVLSQLDRTQLAQVLQDKFDARHSMRRRFRRQSSGPRKPVVLLPSAYFNVSRTAVSYAAMLPEEQFLLVCARNTAKFLTRQCSQPFTGWLFQFKRQQRTCVTTEAMGNSEGRSHGASRAVPINGCRRRAGSNAGFNPLGSGNPGCLGPSAGVGECNRMFLRR